MDLSACIVQSHAYSKGFFTASEEFHRGLRNKLKLNPSKMKLLLIKDSVKPQPIIYVAGTCTSLMKQVCTVGMILNPGLFMNAQVVAEKRAVMYAHSPTSNSH